MAKKQLNLTYALKDGISVHIDDVESGLKCGCICPACGAQLVAKKGAKMMHHFSHHTGQNCEYGYESSLHLAAKDILSRAQHFTLPPVYIEFPQSYREKILLSEAKKIAIEYVELEKRFNDIVPDIVVYAGGKQLFVEICVTHSVDEKKLDKLRKSNISTIEIDLSKYRETVTKEELTDILLSDNDSKVWKYNSLANRHLKRFYGVADRRELVGRGYTVHVDNCPIKSRVWRGKPYASFFDDCLYCKYCISAENEDGILCSGRLRISSLEDFDIPEEMRIKNSDKEIADAKYKELLEGRCPNCGHKLVERNSKYGEFWGCSNYPYCQFTASPDPITGELKMKS